MSGREKLLAVGMVCGCVFFTALFLSLAYLESLKMTANCG